MTFLAVTLLPITLAVGVLRYWLVGLTGVGAPGRPSDAPWRDRRARDLSVGRRADRRGDEHAHARHLELPAVGDGLHAHHRCPVRRSATHAEPAACSERCW